jgi:hypothetical protein
MKLFVNESPNAPIDRNIELHQKIELSSNRVDLRCLLYVVHDRFRNRERLSQGTFYPYKQRLRSRLTHTAHRNTVFVNCNSEIGAIRDRKDALLKKTGVLVSKEGSTGLEINEKVNQLFRCEAQAGIPPTACC